MSERMVEKLDCGVQVYDDFVWVDTWKLDRSMAGTEEMTEFLEAAYVLAMLARKLFPRAQSAMVDLSFFSENELDESSGEVDDRIL